jgi:predicted transcriptional regulator
LNPDIGRRRDRLLITIEILNVAKGGIIKTHILELVGLSYEQLTRYLNFLKANGFIKVNNGKYHTTQKGNALISEFESSPLTHIVLAA